MSTESTMQAALQVSPEPEARLIGRGDTLVPEEGDDPCWADGCDSLNGNGKRPLQENSKEKDMADIAFLHGRNEILRNMRDGLEQGTVKDTGTKASIQSLTDDIAHNEKRIAQLEHALWKQKCKEIDAQDKEDKEDVQNRLLTPCTDKALRKRFLDDLEDCALVEFVLQNAKSDPIVQQTLQGIRDNDLELVESAREQVRLALQEATEPYELAMVEAWRADDTSEATIEHISRLEGLQEHPNGLECVADAAYRAFNG